ncbi:TrkH family potassium uptake protein [Candidatus Poriferisocius sp.]|uniref:TrkH family potassium uptake protein n=1 Tax=Candidatus Poriferisocius sp. TaxID=3101276 RepID=UPI003B029DD6
MSDPLRVRFPWHRSAVRVLTTVVATAAALVVVSAIVYLASGEVGRADDALFESVAGFTTTSLTVLDPEALPAWLLSWRATTQWLGGAGALAFALVVVPTFGGQRRLSEVAEGRGRRAVLSSTWSHTTRRVALAYVGFTAAVIAAYAAAGMGPFDAATFGLATASTGGFANYRDSFAHFDSAAVEWVGAWAMGLAGMSVAALVWLARGQVRALWRSTELKVYAALTLVSTTLVAAWTWRDAGGGADTIRQSFFTVTSAMSTTGFRVTDWGGWVTAPQTLLLLLIGVGSMAGSAGGGFRLLRVIQILGIVRRELVLQLHPRAVVPVKVSGAVVSAGSLTRVHNFQILWVLAAAVGVFGIASLGGDLPTAMSGSISALATAGPGLGELSGFADATALAAPARAVLMALMFLGRLSIYPVVVVVGWGVGGVQRMRLRQ